MLLTILLVAVVGLIVLFTVAPLRRALVTPRVLALFKRILPQMSSTERDALDAGTTWWDADLFSGQPDWPKLLAVPKPVLTAEERHFLDNDVERLCELVNDWQTQQDNDLPPAAWAFMKSQGFLGMIIPKKYGGSEQPADLLLLGADVVERQRGIDFAHDAAGGGDDRTFAAGVAHGKVRGRDRPWIELREREQGHRTRR